MKAKLEEAREFSWNSKDDEDFKKKSEETIDETIEKLEKDVLVELAEFLYQLKEKRQQVKGGKDQDKQLGLAKELSNDAMDEDYATLEAGDQHVSEIIAKFAEDERDEYIEFREKIEGERVNKRVKVNDSETVIDVDTDPPPPSKGEESNYEGKKALYPPTKIKSGVVGRRLPP